MHLFYFREAWRSFTRHSGLATTAIFSLTASLAVCGVFLLLAHNAQLTMDLVGNRREIVVYLRDEVSPTERDAMIARLEPLYGTVTYISKDQAWQEFSEEVGDASLLAGVDGNPLPASLRIRLKPELLNYNSMEEASKQLAAFPEVEDVRFGGEWVKQLDNVSRGLLQGALVVGLLVALGMVFVLYNTIRLTVLARRPQVEIMSRLGAADRFIATPFVIEAMLQAAIASVLALGVVFAFHQAFILQVVPIVFLPWTWIAAFLGAALALAWLAAMLALSRVLRSVGA